MAHYRRIPIHEIPTLENEVREYIYDLINNCPDPCQIDTAIPRLKYTEVKYRNEWILNQREKIMKNPVQQHESYLYDHIHTIKHFFYLYCNYADSPENKNLSYDYKHIAEFDEWLIFLNTLEFLEPLLPVDKKLRNEIGSRSNKMLPNNIYYPEPTGKPARADVETYFYNYVLPAYANLWKEVYRTSDISSSELPDDFFLLSIKEKAPYCYSAIRQAINDGLIEYNEKMEEKYDFQCHQKTVSQFFKAGGYTEWTIITENVRYRGHKTLYHSIKTSKKENPDSIKILEKYYPPHILEKYYLK